MEVSLFFFFQAEDGIRDYKVTGVQTCALPIYRELACRLAGPRQAPAFLLPRRQIPPPALASLCGSCGIYVGSSRSDAIFRARGKAGPCRGAEGRKGQPVSERHALFGEHAGV